MPNTDFYYQACKELRPIIVVGMHRSGTSLLTRLFGDLGIHMGGWLSRDAEAVFFQKINRMIYRRLHAHWAEPETLIAAMTSQPFVEAQVGVVRKRLVGARVRFGMAPRMQKNFSPDSFQRLLEGESFVWGFKDPRTALVIPIWQQVFPRARWVHIYRSGVDVALSLHLRALRQQRKALLKFYRFDFSERTLDFGYCFNLWEVYLDAIHQALAAIEPSHVYEMRYEALLDDPKVELSKVLGFLDFQVTDPELEEVVQQVDRSRLDNSSTIRNYQELIADLPSSRWIEALGYSSRGR